MIENADQQLSELGAVPEDIQAIVTRTLGDRPITPALADELLDALSAGRQFELPAAPAMPAAPPAIADAAAVISSISAPPPALDSVAPPPALDSVAPPPVLDSVAPPPAGEPSLPAPMPWDSLPAPAVAPAAAPVSLVAAAPMPWDSEPAPQPPAAEETAQAIVAAFDDPEPEARTDDTLESSPAPKLQMEPAPNLELNARAPRRADWSGSRRPDLDELLDQPLDALDFERSEQTDVVQTDVVQTEPRAEEAAAPEPAASATTPPSSGDDFEILVDDEILEIAEDDVELMDDENS